MKKEIRKLRIITTLLLVLGVFYGSMIQAKVSNDITDEQMPIFRSDFDRLFYARDHRRHPDIKKLGSTASPHYLTGTCYQIQEADVMLENLQILVYPDTVENPTTGAITHQPLIYARFYYSEFNEVPFTSLDEAVEELIHQNGDMLIDSGMFGNRIQLSRKGSYSPQDAEIVFVVGFKETVQSKRGVMSATALRFSLARDANDNHHLLLINDTNTRHISICKMGVYDFETQTTNYSISDFL